MLERHTKSVRLDGTPQRQFIPDSPVFQLGAIEVFMGWEASLPDLESLSIERLSLTSPRFPDYELLGPDRELLAPWSDGDQRGILARPFDLVVGGKPVAGDEAGTVNLYVRRKRP
jgi:hypothetical protein